MFSLAVIAPILLTVASAHPAATCMPNFAGQSIVIKSVKVPGEALYIPPPATNGEAVRFSKTHASVFRPEFDGQPANDYIIKCVNTYLLTESSANWCWSCRVGGVSDNSLLIDTAPEGHTVVASVLPTAYVILPELHVGAQLTKASLQIANMDNHLQVVRRSRRACRFE